MKSGRENLEELRRRIDETDAEIFSLLSRRMDLALETLKFKKVPRDADREKQVLRNISSLSGRSAKRRFVTNIFRAVIRNCAAYQERHARKTEKKRD